MRDPTPVPSSPAFPPRPAASDRVAALCRLAAELAAAETGQPVEAVLSRVPGVGPGGRRFAAARALAMYLAHVRLGLPMRRVAAGFSRHPSTVAHACQRVEERREAPEWDRRITRLEEAAVARIAAPRVRAERPVVASPDVERPEVARHG